MTTLETERLRLRTWTLDDFEDFAAMSAGLLDLRLMGFMTRVPVAAIMQMRPWAAVGIAVNVVTGLLFFVGTPEQYIRNVAW